MSTEKGRIRIEIHVHTLFSFDSRAGLEEVEEAAIRAGVDLLAVTDHDTIEGALRLRDRGRIGVVVGEEVTSSLGDIIGLFLERPVPAGLEPEETIDAIRDQGGVVIVPHPFDAGRGTALFPEALERCAPRIDAIEGWNGRVRRAADNERALRFAREKGLPAIAGSDAHSPEEIGRWTMRIDPFRGATEFLERLPRAEPEIPARPEPPERHRWLTRLFRPGLPVPPKPEPGSGA